MKKWQCIVCGFIYDEEEGLEEEGIAPGTRWEDIPEDWVCPECGVGKAEYALGVTRMFFRMGSAAFLEGVGGSGTSPETRAKFPTETLSSVLQRKRELKGRVS